jgi:hypothetical protein
LWLCLLIGDFGGESPHSCANGSLLGSVMGMWLVDGLLLHWLVACFNCCSNQL